MARLQLSIAMGDYDRTRALFDGRVQVDGVDPVYMLLSPEEMFFRAMRSQDFDVVELSFSSYLVKHARGDCPYIAIPVFLSRAFRHTSIYVRKDRIREPRDLAGKRVGLPEYQLSANVWARALLQDDYGVPGGIPGIVKGVSNVFGENQYNVKWKNGSSLALIEGVDQWLKVVDEEEKEEEEDIQETRVLTKKQFLEETRKIENIPQEYVKYSRMYDMREIKKFLDLLRESGVTNMYQAAPYLYLGKERISHEHHYDDMGEEKEEIFQELLDHAEDVRNVMIRGAFNHFDSKRSDDEGDEDDDDRRYLRGVEDIMRRDAQTLLKLWMSMKSGSRGMR